MFSKLLKTHNTTNFSFTADSHMSVIKIVEDFCPYNGNWIYPRNDSWQNPDNWMTPEQKLEWGKKLHELFAEYFECDEDCRAQIATEINEFTNGQINIEDDITSEFRGNNWTPLKANCRMKDDKRRIVGKPNLLLTDDNDNIVILDWKFGRHIYNPNKDEFLSEIEDLSKMKDFPNTSEFWRVALKLNLYRAMLVNVYGLNVTKMVLVCINDDYEIIVTDIPLIEFVQSWYAKLK